ncbi:hypothetical protein OG754_08930 [Streptomyces decoyicus]|uniref:hypothetical protein n=1 Tax=Streptomyces decoyicus TaxID=249567 RepID=UPI002E3394ED|nr:hypothetical protein [Streptomyces decoyicus]
MGAPFVFTGRGDVIPPEADVPLIVFVLAELEPPFRGLATPVPMDPATAGGGTILSGGSIGFHRSRWGLPAKSCALAL